jgi:hypothetical protein
MSSYHDGPAQASRFAKGRSEGDPDFAKRLI